MLSIKIRNLFFEVDGIEFQLRHGLCADAGQSFERDLGLILHGTEETVPHLPSTRGFLSAAKVRGGVPGGILIGWAPLFQSRIDLRGV